MKKRHADMEEDDMPPEYDFSDAQRVEQGRFYKLFWRRRGGRLLESELAGRYPDDQGLNEALREALSQRDESVAPDPPLEEWSPSEEALPPKQESLGVREEEGRRYTSVRLVLRDAGPWREWGGRFLGPNLAERFPGDESVNRTLRKYLRLKRESA